MSEATAEVMDAPGWRGDIDVLVAGHRTASWSFELLDSENRVVDELDGVSACGVEWNVNAAVRSGGSLTYTGAAIDWMVRRLRVHYTAKAYGRERTWTLGTFIPSSPATKYEEQEIAPRELELFDAMHLVDIQTSTASAWSVKSGENVVDRLRLLLGNAGYQHSIEDSPETARTDMLWPAGTPYLRIANDMLSAINYFSLSADPYGIFRAGPYVAPQSRGEAWVFRDDGQSIYTPDIGHSMDTYSVPNQVILVSSVEGDELPLKAIATDTTSPYSYENRRIRVNHVEEGVEAASLSILEDLAVRRLSELQRVTSTYSINHLPIPLALNDVVRLVRTRHGLDVLATVQTMSMSMGEGLCATTLREVSSG